MWDYHNKVHKQFSNEWKAKREDSVRLLGKWVNYLEHIVAGTGLYLERIIAFVGSLTFITIDVNRLTKQQNRALSFVYEHE